jgi:hypothetical protein
MKKKHATVFKFSQVVYIMYARHQTPKMRAPKMRCKDAKGLQKARLYFRTMCLDVY